MGLTGFEPVTSAVSRRCASSCATSPGIENRRSRDRTDDLLGVDQVLYLAELPAFGGREGIQPSSIWLIRPSAAQQNLARSGSDGDRTRDLLAASQALSQLSYQPTNLDPIGVEPIFSACNTEVFPVGRWTRWVYQHATYSPCRPYREAWHGVPNAHQLTFQFSKIGKWRIQVHGSSSIGLSPGIYRRTLTWLTPPPLITRPEKKPLQDFPERLSSRCRCSLAAHFVTPGSGEGACNLFRRIQGVYLRTLSPDKQIARQAHWYFSGLCGAGMFWSS